LNHNVLRTISQERRARRFARSVGAAELNRENHIQFGSGTISQVQ
jgi:hypothetical protein